jgi:hypothetical protein
MDIILTISARSHVPSSPEVYLNVSKCELPSVHEVMVVYRHEFWSPRGSPDRPTPVAFLARLCP